MGNLPVGVLPDIESVVDQGVLIVKPEDAVVGFGVQAVLFGSLEDLLDVNWGYALLIPQDLAHLDDFQEGVAVLWGELDGEVQVL